MAAGGLLAAGCFGEEVDEAATEPPVEPAEPALTEEATGVTPAAIAGGGEERLGQAQDQDIVGAVGGGIGGLCIGAFVGTLIGGPVGLVLGGAFTLVGEEIGSHYGPEERPPFPGWSTWR